MAINFPDAPANGTEYAVGNRTWVYNSVSAIWAIKEGTYTANGIVYANTTNTIATLAVVNNGIVVTNASGIPSVATVLPAVTIASQGLTVDAVARKDYVDTTAIAMSVTFGY